MCIRDRFSPLHLYVSMKARLVVIRVQPCIGVSMKAQLVVISCLLYTSDAARRIERSPSRGLGDVYKRQILSFAFVCEHESSIGGYKGPTMYRGEHESSIGGYKGPTMYRGCLLYTSDAADE